MTKRRKSGKKSNATKLAHLKFRFIEQVIADSRLSPLAMRSAIFVGCKCSLDHGGQAIIGQDKIAEGLDAWRQDVSRALQQAAALGHIEIIRRGRDHANGYRMVLKDEARATDDVTDSVTSEPPDDVGEFPTSRPHMMSGNPDFDVGKNPTDSPFFSPGALTEPQGEEREAAGGENGERAPAGAGNTPSAGTPPLSRHPADLSPAATFSPSAKPESPIERPPGRRDRGNSSQENWRELRAIWTRPWADDDAANQRAFQAACREVDDPAVILEAARATVEAIEDPRYLQPLSKWLSRRTWEKAPPTKRKRADGTRYAPGRRSDGLPRTNGNKVDTAKVFFEMAGYVEDDDGNMVRGDVQ